MNSNKDQLAIRVSVRAMEFFHNREEVEAVITKVMEQQPIPEGCYYQGSLSNTTYSTGLDIVIFNLGSEGLLARVAMPGENKFETSLKKI